MCRRITYLRAPFFLLIKIEQKYSPNSPLFSPSQPAPTPKSTCMAASLAGTVGVARRIARHQGHHGQIKSARIQRVAGRRRARRNATTNSRLQHGGTVELQGRRDVERKPAMEGEVMECGGCSVYLLIHRHRLPLRDSVPIPSGMSIMWEEGERSGKWEGQ